MKKLGIYLLTASAVLVFIGAYLKLEGWSHAGTCLGAGLGALVVGLVLFVVATVEGRPGMKGEG